MPPPPGWRAHLSLLGASGSSGHRRCCHTPPSVHHQGWRHPRPAQGRRRRRGRLRFLPPGLDAHRDWHAAPMQPHAAPGGCGGRRPLCDDGGCCGGDGGGPAGRLVFCSPLQNSSSSHQGAPQLSSLTGGEGAALSDIGNVSASGAVSAADGRPSLFSPPQSRPLLPSDEASKPQEQQLVSKQQQQQQQQAALVELVERAWREATHRRCVGVGWGAVWVWVGVGLVCVGLVWFG